MFRLGFWIFAAALFGLVMIFLPALTTETGEAQMIADTIFCDGHGSASMTLTLNSQSLAKGNLAALITGDCLQAGRLSQRIPTARFSDVLTIAGIAAFTGLMLMGIGLLRRRSYKSEIAAAAAQEFVAQHATLIADESAASYAARTRQRDSEDARARRNAATARTTAAASAVPRPATAPAALADWQIGLPSSVLAPIHASERFSFDSTTPPALDDDKLIQLNQLQLAYESSMITRSEYDARRDALMRAALANYPEAR